MKIELFYTGDNEGELIRKFLLDHKIPFSEILVKDIILLEKLAQTRLHKMISLIKITYAHSIYIILGYNEHLLNQQILEHIKKYRIQLK